MSFARFCSSPFLKVAVWNKFSGANFCFQVVCCGLVFFGVLARFCFMVWCFAPETVLKNISSRQVSLFGVRSLCLRFFASMTFLFACFVLFYKRESSGSHRTAHTPALFWFLFFLFFCSRRICVIARFGRASFLSGVSLGAPFWAPRVFRIFLELPGLDTRACSAPLRPFFLGREVARRFSSFLFSSFLFSPSVVFAASHVSLDARVGDLTEVGHR